MKDVTKFKELTGLALQMSTYLHNIQGIESGLLKNKKVDLTKKIKDAKKEHNYTKVRDAVKHFEYKLTQGEPVETMLKLNMDLLEKFYDVVDPFEEEIEEINVKMRTAKTYSSIQDANIELAEKCRGKGGFGLVDILSNAMKEASSNILIDKDIKDYRKIPTSTKTIHNSLDNDGKTPGVINIVESEVKDILDLPNLIMTFHKSVITYLQEHESLATSESAIVASYASLKAELDALVKGENYDLADCLFLRADSVEERARKVLSIFPETDLADVRTVEGYMEAIKSTASIEEANDQLACMYIESLINTELLVKPVVAIPTAFVFGKVAEGLDKTCLAMDIYAKKLTDELATLRLENTKEAQEAYDKITDAKVLSSLGEVRYYMETVVKMFKDFHMILSYGLDLRTIAFTDFTINRRVMYNTDKYLLMVSFILADLMKKDFYTALNTRSGEVLFTDISQFIAEPFYNKTDDEKKSVLEAIVDSHVRLAATIFKHIKLYNYTNEIDLIRHIVSFAPLVHMFNGKMTNTEMLDMFVAAYDEYVTPKAE